MGCIDPVGCCLLILYSNVPFGNGLWSDASVAFPPRHGELLLDFCNRENIKFCKEHGIRLSGPRLGRPKASEIEADREQAYKDSCDRNEVEGRIGIGKRRYGLDLIYARLEETGEVEAAMNILAMNVAHVLRALLRFFEKLGVFFVIRLKLRRINSFACSLVA